MLRRTSGSVLPGPAAASSEAEERVEVGALCVDLGSREAWCNGKELALTPVEFDMLVLLMRSAGRVLSRDRLARAALGRVVDPLDRSVDTHISNLRRKLGEQAEGSSLIRTVRSAGYMVPRPRQAT